VWFKAKELEAGSDEQEAGIKKPGSQNPESQKLEARS
jgi:hypothetical protein